MDDLLSGVITAVSSSVVSTQTTAIAVAGDVVLFLDDVIDFDPTGQVTIDGGAVLSYVGRDEDLETGVGTLTLDVALTGTVAAGAVVAPYPPKIEKTAMVLRGSDTEPISADVPDDRQDSLRDGIREEEERERVTLKRTGKFSWAVTNLPGQPLERDVDYIATPYVTGSIASTLSIPNDSDTLITGWTITATEGWTLSAGALTSPKTGLYLVTFGARWVANSSGRRSIHSQKVDTLGVVQAGWIDTRPSDATPGFSNLTVQPYYLAQGDQLKFYAYQNSGAALDLRASPDDTMFSVTWIGQ